MDFILIVIYPSKRKEFYKSASMTRQQDILFEIPRASIYLKLTGPIIEGVKIKIKTIYN